MRSPLRAAPPTESPTESPTPLVAFYRGMKCDGAGSGPNLLVCGPVRLTAWEYKVCACRAVRGGCGTVDRFDMEPEAVLNVGGGNPVRLDALVAAVGAACGVEVSVEHQGEQPGDVPLTWADPGLIEKTLGWQAEVGLEEGLRRVVESMR